MKYRKKPLIIEAEQWFPEFPTIKEDQKQGFKMWKCGVWMQSNINQGYCINTLEGKADVIPGDWIITGIEGEKYPCKDSIFRKSYEIVK